MVHSWNPPTVILIGIGMAEELSWISTEIKNLVSQAELIVCAETLISALNHITEAEKLTIKSPLAPIIERVERESKYKKVMVIASGDPLFYGIGRQLGDLLGRDRLIVFPNITSVQYLFSKLAMPWDDVMCFSLHSEERRDFFYWLRHGRKIAILTGPSFPPSFIAELIEDHNMGDMVDMVIGEKLGTKEEKISKLTPAKIRKEQWKNPNIVALFPKYSVKLTGGFFPEEMFLHDRGMITKLEVRTLAVSALRLKVGDILWDLGAGSGSISIEASYRVPLRSVHAVERDPKRYEQLLTNVKRFHCGEIICYLEDATNLVSRLPRPDSIFIGGGGKELGLILKTIIDRFGKDHMPSIVVSAVLWDSVNEVIRTARSCDLSFSVTHFQVSRSVPLIDSFRFEPLAPVFLVSFNQRVKL
ncbi:MAG: precorrin-6y C5,15-methyltransferase (decarboxylating) subunit CbiE [Syntrophobacterales bacterium]|nr:precorrin-6y C5,15-methyltransferase (decarboxylating) subunit CbiE [Syntrophobacterales bacterium]